MDNIYLIINNMLIENVAYTFSERFWWGVNAPSAGGVWLFPAILDLVLNILSFRKFHRH